MSSTSTAISSAPGQEDPWPRTVLPSPASARRSARSSSRTTSRPTWYGCGMPPTSPVSFRAVHPDLLVLHPRRAPTPTAPGRGAAPDARTHRVAEEARVVLLHENEKDIFGDIPRRCLDIMESVGSPNLRLPGTPPTSFRSAFSRSPRGTQLLRPHLAYVQIKDAAAGDGRCRAPPVTATAISVETVRALRPRRIRRLLLPRAAPHQDPCAGRFLRTRALHTEAWRAFTHILQTEHITYA